MQILILAIQNLKPVIFVRNDKSINFYLIIGSDIIYQHTLTVSGNDVAIYKHKNAPNNYLVKVINSNAITFDSKVKYFQSSSLQNSNPQVLNQNTKWPFDQVYHFSTKIKEIYLVKENLVSKVKGAEKSVSSRIKWIKRDSNVW